MVNSMFLKYILLFFLYSFLGWLMEVVYTFIRERKFVNRGFLKGPYCPIYGLGCVFLSIVLTNFNKNIFLLFIITFTLCFILEYMTSLVLEKIFHLRWWDYSNYKFNINGRVCLETILPFSIIGIIAIKYINPLLLEFIDSLSKYFLITISVVLICLFIFDLVISYDFIAHLKNIRRNTGKDATEVINRKRNE